LHKAQVKVDEGERVLGVDGQDGAFRVQTSKASIDARKVVLATGRRGNFRASSACPARTCPMSPTV